MSSSLESLDTDLVKLVTFFCTSTDRFLVIKWFKITHNMTFSLPCQSNGWDPDDMFKYNEETYGVKSTYDSSLSSYT